MVTLSILSNLSQNHILFFFNLQGSYHSNAISIYSRTHLKLELLKREKEKKMKKKNKMGRM